MNKNKKTIKFKLYNRIILILNNSSVSDILLKMKISRTQRCIRITKIRSELKRFKIIKHCNPVIKALKTLSMENVVQVKILTKATVRNQKEK